MAYVWDVEPADDQILSSNSAFGHVDYVYLENPRKQSHFPYTLSHEDLAILGFMLCSLHEGSVLPVLISCGILQD